MKLLLDTQSLIWWVNDDPKLGAAARAVIADKRSIVLVSTVSFWEVSIKHRVGKLDDIGSELMKEVKSNGFCVVGIEERHLELLENLVARPGHRDPFDHMILVQAISEEAILITSDAELRGYGVRCL